VRRIDSLSSSSLSLSLSPLSFCLCEKEGRKQKRRHKEAYITHYRKMYFFCSCCREETPLPLLATTD